MIRIQPDQIENPQQLTAVVAGPDSTNRLFILDGQLVVGIAAVASGVTVETFSVLLGPVLTRQQFAQATGGLRRSRVSRSAASLADWAAAARPWAALG